MRGGHRRGGCDTNSYRLDYKSEIKIERTDVLLFFLFCLCGCYCRIFLSVRTISGILKLNFVVAELLLAVVECG